MKGYGCHETGESVEDYSVGLYARSRTSTTGAEGLPRSNVTWVQPQVVVQVGFIEWTVHGKLRHPRLIGVHDDKNAREVVREP